MDHSVWTAVGGFVLTVFAWFLNREVKRIDALGDRVKTIEETGHGFVSKSDLDRTEARIITAIGEVKQGVNAAHERIDRLKDSR